MPSDDPEAIEYTTSLMANVLSAYPERFLAAAETREILVCAEVHSERGLVIGLALAFEHRFLISAASSAETVHHEVFHMVDRNALLQDPDPDDSMWIQWPRLNPDGFHYGPHTGRPAGFVSRYAATDDEEDRADTFGTLMGAADVLCGLARGDEILRAKVRLIWHHSAALAGTDEFLRRAAPCVDWID